jgi:hypothetical protein
MNHLPPWWKESLVSDMIRRRGVDFFIHPYNHYAQIDNTMSDIKMTWIRSATISGYTWAPFALFVERGRLSRLEELKFTPISWSLEPFNVPQCFSGTLHTLVLHECTPVLNCVLHKLRKLSITYTEDNFTRGSHWQRDWRTLPTFAPNLKEFSLLHQTAFLDIRALSTTAKDVELDWTTIRSLAALSPEVVKIRAERMRVRVDTVICTNPTELAWNDYPPANGSSLMEALWNSFFTTTGLGQMIQQLTIYRSMHCTAWHYNLLQPFTGLRILELEGNIGRWLINSLSVQDSGGSGSSDTRSEETQKMAVACPNLERLVIRNSDLDGEALMGIISERNNSAWVLKGKVRLLKHVEIWNCPGVSAQTRQSLRLLRDQVT